MSLSMPSPRAVRAALAATVTLLALPGGAGAADFDRPTASGGYGDPYDDPRYADLYGQRAPSGAAGASEGYRYRYRYVDRSSERAEEAPPEERYREGADADIGPSDRYAEDRRDEGVRVDRYEEEPAPEERPRAYGGDARRADPPRSYKDDDDARHAPPRRHSDAPLPGPRHYRDDREPPTDHRHGCTPRREIRRALMHEGWFDFRGLELRGDVALVRARRDNGRMFELKLDRCTGRVLRAEVISAPDRGHWVAGPRRFYPTY